MTNDRTDVPRPPHATSSPAATAHDEALDADAARDDTEQTTTSAHFGAVEGETSPVIPPMHESSGSGDEIDPVDEVTPG